MKNLCITGSVQTSLERFADVLIQAGATPALPASRNAAMGMATWHRKVLAVVAAREEDLRTAPTLGRVWEQMAGDIFLANHEQPLWFWADAGSVALLDFWREFDPGTCFVLLHTSPRQALVEAIERGATRPEELDNVLDDWYQRTQQVLRFHLRHPARSILVDGDHALGQAGAYLEALASRWQLPLVPQDIEPPVQANDPLLDYLVDELLQQRPEALALDGEVQASLFLPSAALPQAAAPELNDGALASYLKTRQQHLSERQAHARLLEQLKIVEIQLEQTQSDLSETRANLDDAEEESRLQLERLHQIQEECERLILDHQRNTREQQSLSQKAAQQLAETTAAKDALAQQNAALQQRLDALAKEKAGLTTARDEQAKLASERQARIDTLAKEKTDLTAARDKLTGERDQQAKLAAERQVQLDTLAKQQAELLATHDALAKSEAQQRAQMEDIQSENELLLLNLHQTQEECERLILDHQRTTREQQSLSQKAAQQLAETTAAKDKLAQENAALQQRLDALAKEKAGLTAARDEQAKLANERQARIDSLAKEKTDLTAARDKLTAERDQQAKLANERQVQLDTLAKQQAELLATRDALAKSEAQQRAQIQDIQSENELLLLNLHQTQEECERLILDHQRTTREQQSLSQKAAQQLAETTAAKDKLAQENAALQQRLDALAKEKADLTAARDKLAGERDQQAKLAAERQVQLDTLAKQQAELLAARDALAKSEAQQRAQIEDIQSENELLLLNLHQTQEELEQYLLRAQATEAQCAKLNNCLQRVLSSHPDYWMFDRLEASLLESTDTQQTVQWQLTDVYLGERLIPELRFKTVLANGLAGIVIQRSAGIDSPEPLLRWPGACATAEELPCIPVPGSAAQGNNALLTALGPTDWKALQTLVNRLAGLLGQPDSAPLPEGLDAAGLRSGLLALEATLAAWPKLLRYDAIELQETPQGGGYQGLAISLANLQLGERHWPALDYRLASVDEPGQSFGQNPRLEFPESTRTALQNWFAESDDERGARLELRFALPDALDTRVWNRLDGDDRLLIAALLASLGSQLQALRQASAASQPGQDWPTVVGAMKNILARHAVASHHTQGA